MTDDPPSRVRQRTRAAGAWPIIALVSVVLAASGCSTEHALDLDGRWVGEIPWPTRIAVVDQAATEPPSRGPLRLYLTLNQGRFISRLESEQEALPQREGRFRVVSQLGPRWEIELTPDEEQAGVTLQLTLSEPDQVTVRQFNGDDRIAQWQMTRSSATP